MILASSLKAKSKGVTIQMKPLELLFLRVVLFITLNKLILIFAFLAEILSLNLKVMLHETIRNDDFLRNTALQHC